MNEEVYFMNEKVNLKEPRGHLWCDYWREGNIIVPSPMVPFWILTLNLSIQGQIDVTNYE